MAGRGVDVVSIDYRLGLRDASPADLASQELFARKLVSAIRMAVDDLYSATAFILNRAEAWGSTPSGSSPADRAPAPSPYFRGIRPLQRGPERPHSSGRIPLCRRDLLAGAIFQLGEGRYGTGSPHRCCSSTATPTAMSPMMPCVSREPDSSARNTSQANSRSCSPLRLLLRRGSRARDRRGAAERQPQRDLLLSAQPRLRPQAADDRDRGRGDRPPEANTSFTLEDYIRSNFSGN